MLLASTSGETQEGFPVAPAEGDENDDQVIEPFEFGDGSVWEQFFEILGDGSKDGEPGSQERRFLMKVRRSKATCQWSRGEDADGSHGSLW